MIRILLFLALAGTAVAYAAWVYRRLELRVPATRWLTVARALVFITLLALLFDPRLGSSADGAGTEQWALLDASLSMTAGPTGASAWEQALARAEALEADGWTVVRFGDGAASATTRDVPSDPATVLTPALERAAEAGAREVRVLSDLRLQDGVGVRAALEVLPLQVDFEAFGTTITNAGVSSLTVPDAPRPEGTIPARVEIHGVGSDSATVELRADGELVATERISLPAPGLRRAYTIDIPVPAEGGRVRYTASVAVPDDQFASDDEGVTYASVGHREGALVLVSLRPDWEPRFLLPLLGEVTGLSSVGYLRAGDDRFVTIGPAIDRAAPVDSATVRRAVRDAEMVVFHGLSGAIDDWTRALVQRPGRRIMLPVDLGGAALAGVATRAVAGGEWYASGDLPSSPISAELSGAALLGLPPLTDVLVPTELTPVSPVLVQLRGTGEGQAAFHLDSDATPRRVVGLSSGTWRWAMRPGQGADAYRRLWSGLAGWLLADQTAIAPEPRPARWVFDRGEPVEWRLPGDSVPVRITVLREEDPLADTVLTGIRASLGVLDPGSYTYRASDPDGGLLGEGRFDVARATEELLPVAQNLESSTGTLLTARSAAGQGTPLRTSPWPYLLVIMLLCGEWIARRRTGLR